MSENYELLQKNTTDGKSPMDVQVRGARLIGMPKTKG